MLAGTVPVTVYTATPGGDTGNAINFIVTAGNNLLPVATWLTPNNVTMGGRSLTLAVTVSNFISSSVIKWNNAALTTTFFSSGYIHSVMLHSGSINRKKTF